MMFKSCPKEPELTDALREQRWPEACEASLRAHVESCSECGEQVAVTQALQQARVQSTQAAPLQHPGILWWRAQLLRRNEAIARVNKPVAVAEKIAWLGTLAIAIGVAVWQRELIADGVKWLGGLSRSGNFGVGGWSLALMAAAVGTITLLGGVVLYLVAKQE
jgi:hypothetical protein